VSSEIVGRADRYRVASSMSVNAGQWAGAKSGVASYTAYLIDLPVRPPSNCISIHFSRVQTPLTSIIF
jgi:hypothetical protein